MSIKQNGGVFGRNPTFNDVTIEGQLTFDGDIDVNSDLKVDGNLDVTGTGDFGGKVKVTTASNGEIEVARTSGALINLQAQSARGIIGTNSNHELQLKSNNTGRLKITTGGNVEVMSGNLVIGTSGKGIDFSATAGTGTSELFDDYEEGAWTPTYAITGGSFSSITYNAYTGGVYTKVGNVVYVSGYITTNSAVVSVDGGLTIEGLPFATGSGTGLSTRSTLTIGEVIAFGTNYPTSGRFQAGTSRIYLNERSSANGASTFLQASNMGNTAQDNQIAFSGFYMI
jgi:hypothetical protein